MLPLGDIIRIILHGLLQKVLLLIPVVLPLQESLSPPSWWYAFFDWGAWYYNLDSNRRPNLLWTDYYLYSGWGWLKKLAVHEAEQYTLAARAFLIMVIGPIFYGFSSISGWLNNVDIKVGWTLPSWAASTMAGLWKLWHWLPWEVREGGWNWDGLWDWLVDRAIAIAHNLFDIALDWGWEAVRWVRDTGGHLRTWWLAVQAFVWWLAHDPYGAIASILNIAWPWLVEFKLNPIGWVLGWLSPWWVPLTTFARDCLTYWYNVWGSHAQDLSNFLANPLDFIADRLEQIIESRW